MGFAAQDLVDTAKRGSKPLIVSILLLALAWILIVISLATHHWITGSVTGLNTKTQWYYGIYSATSCSTIGNSRVCDTVSGNYSETAAYLCGGSLIIITILIPVLMLLIGLTCLRKDFGPLRHKFATFISSGLLVVLIVLLAVSIISYPAFVTVPAYSDISFSYYLQLVPLLLANKK